MWLQFFEMENESRGERKPVEEKKGTKMEKQMTKKACAEEERKKTKGGRLLGAQAKKKCGRRKVLFKKIY